MKVFINIITYLLVISFSFQNVVWAGGENFLAPDSKKDLAEVAEAFRTHSGSKDAVWKDFSDGKEGAGMPFEINPAIFSQFQAKFGHLSNDIIGDVGADGEFHIPTEIENRFEESSKIKAKVNKLIQSLDGVFEHGTRVRIITNTRRSLFYNKNDNILEIHGLLLLEGISDQLLHFCGSHEARHKEITGLNPVLEEVLNIYMDFEYLDTLEPQKQTDILNELERIDASGYIVLLRNRNKRKNETTQDAFFKAILDHIIQNYSWILQEAGLTDPSQQSIQAVLKLLNKEIPYLKSFYNYLKASYNSEELPPELLSFHQHLPFIADFLYKHIDFFSKLNHEIVMLSGYFRHGFHTAKEAVDEFQFDESLVLALVEIMMNREIVYSVYTSSGKDNRDVQYVHKDNSVIESLVPGYDLLNRRNIYIPKTYEAEEWARPYIIWYQLRKEFIKRGFIEKEVIEIEEFFKSIFTINDINNIAPLELALLMTQAGASKSGIKAGFIAAIKGQEIHVSQEVSTILKHYRQIAEVTDYQLFFTKHMIQNVINLMIQLSEGDSDALMLAIVEKIYELEKFRSNPSKYNDLSQSEKELLRQTIEWVYIPLVEALGRNDLSDRMRNLYLRMVIGEEMYTELLEKYITKSAGFDDVAYEALPAIFEQIVAVIRSTLEDFPVNITLHGRVKSPYSVYHKNRAVKDIFGLRIEVKDGNILDTHILNELYERLKGLMEISEEDKKRFLEKGFNERDFIAVLRTDVDAFRGIFNEHNISKVQMEVQIYPTEDDLKRYQFGANAHWKYKILTVLKRDGVGDQIFDDDILEKLYKNCKDGDFSHNLKLMYSELKKFKFIGVVKEDKLRIVRLNPQSIAPDVAAALVVDSLENTYIGLKRKSSSRGVISNTDVSELTPGIYTVEEKRAGLPEEELQRIKEKTRKPRTYFRIARGLTGKGEDVLEAEGRTLFEQYLKIVGDDLRKGGIDDEYMSYMVKKLFFGEDIPGKKGRGVLERAFSLKRIETFYKILAMVNNPQERPMLMEMIRRVYYYMTNENLPERKTIEELRKDLGLKEDLPDIAVLVYLFTIQDRGEKYLRDIKMFPKNEDSDITKKLSILLDEFKVENLDQLYSKIGLNKILAAIIRLRLASVTNPVITIKLNSSANSNISDEIQDAIDNCGLKVTSIYPIEQGFELSLVPARHWMDKVDLLLQAIRSINEVTTAELIYEDPKVVKTTLQMDVRHSNYREVESVLKELFLKVGVKIIGFSRDGTKFNYELAVPKNIHTSDLKAVLIAWMNNKVSGNVIITNIRFKAQQEVKAPLPAFLFISSVNSPFSVLSMEYIGYIACAIVVMAGVYFLWKYFIKNDKEEYLMKKFSECLTDKKLWMAKLIYKIKPSVIKGYLKDVIFENPKVLILDAEVFDDLSEKNNRKLIDLINQMNGKVAVVSTSGIPLAEIQSRIDVFWNRNAEFLKYNKPSTDDIYTDIEKQGNEFIAEVWRTVRYRFKVLPENVVIFTTIKSFKELWREFIKESLLYILHEDTIYITSEQLNALQKITGKNEILVDTGEVINLLPEQWYKAAVLEEIRTGEVDRGA